jgi:hypothetical protein
MMIRMSAVYFLAGVALGIYMAATHDHSQMPAHAHILLLGWLSLAVGGILYKLWPEAAVTRLAKAHFALYAAGVPIMMGALIALMSGVPKAEPFTAFGAALVGLGVLSFALNVLINFRASPARTLACIVLLTISCGAGLPKAAAASKSCAPQSDSQHAGNPGRAAKERPERCRPHRGLGLHGELGLAGLVPAGGPRPNGKLLCPRFVALHGRNQVLDGVTFHNLHRAPDIHQRAAAGLEMFGGPIGAFAVHRDFEYPEAPGAQLFDLRLRVALYAFQQINQSAHASLPKVQTRSG